MPVNDELGKRMKVFYEQIFQYKQGVNYYKP